MSTYNGHKNWNHWNVALWLFNDETLYEVVRLAQRSVRLKTQEQRAQYILQCLHGMDVKKTPDGAPYTRTAIKAALRE